MHTKSFLEIQINLLAAVILNQRIESYMIVQCLTREAVRVIFALLKSINLTDVQAVLGFLRLSLSPLISSNNIQHHGLTGLHSCILLC